MKNFLLVLLVPIILLGLIVPQFFLDKGYEVHRSVVIQARPGVIVNVVTDLRTWDSWTAWNSDMDATLVRTYTGTPGEPGHRMSWTAEELGDGSLEITAIGPTRVVYKMQMVGKDPSVGAFLMTSDGNGSTTVTWENSGEFSGLPLKRYLGLMIDGMIGPDFEAGLASLRDRIEGASAPAQPAGK